MKALTCPGCGAEMAKEQEPDIIVDTCPVCQGSFFDRGELDAIATGAAGDIEYRPIDVPFHLDRFPGRECPKCAGQTMAKVTLMRLPDLIFDRCPRCKGFYLDRGECDAMNAALRQHAPNQTAEEFRGHIGDRLVRVDRLDHTANEPLASDSGPILMGCHIQVSVFFRNPLAADLRILPNTWSTLPARLFGFATGQRITTGNEAFDEAYTLHATDKERALDLLPQAFIDGMVALTREHPHAFDKPGNITLSRTAICYSEGPYPPEDLTGTIEATKPIVERLLALAETLEPDKG